MPFRFRKIISFGKGFRLNFSKRGMSTSIGGNGAMLNIGKRGVRPTVGLPGTGLSFTPSQSGGQASKTNSMANMTVIVLGSIVVCCFAILCIGFIFIDTEGTKVVSTSTAVVVQGNLATYIAGTSFIAQTQTMIFAPPSSTPFPYKTPTLFIVTYAPSFTPIPTDTPFILASLSAPSAGSVCPCSGDTLNCSDFNSHQAAQACFNSCMAQGAGDIHKLDQNNDGNACESLP